MGWLIKRHYIRNLRFVNRILQEKRNPRQASDWEAAVQKRRGKKKSEGMLKQEAARKHCLDLMKRLEKNGRIDFHEPDCQADPRLGLGYLFGEARGQMFGVLECRDQNGKPVILKAFSGQYNGVWNVPEWVPPLLDAERFDQLVADTDWRIKALGHQIRSASAGTARDRLVAERKQLSRNLMKEIHALYCIHNFQSEVKPIFDFFPNGVPTGAGDCCAPKLLNHAAKNKLRPVSLAEFFWGRGNRSGTRRHGEFYPPCAEKCGPLLGFMLSGVTV